VQYKKAIVEQEKIKGYTQNFNDVYHYPKVFGDDMIEDIHNMVYDNNIPFEKGKTGNDDMQDNHYTNNRDIAYMFPEEYCFKLFDLLEELTIQANEKLFQFNINYVTDPLHYVIYPKPQTEGEADYYRDTGGYLDWHMDIGQGAVNHRKLATIVQLSDPKDYEGGELNFFFGGRWPENILTIPLQKGDACVFPAFYMHGVTPITKGERRALVYWTGGTPYK